VSCAKQPLIQPALDRELAWPHHLRLAAHRALCRECAVEFRRQRRLQWLIRQVGLRTSRRVAAPPRTTRRAIDAWDAWGGQWFGLAASVALVVCLALISLPWGSDPGDDSGLSRALIASHIRTLHADRLVDVPTGGERPLAPWLAARIGMTLPVIDLASDGFPLVGARIDQVAEHPTAVFVYRADDHVINLFVWADASKADLTPGAWSADGYSVCHWRRGDAAFFAVSDLGADELDTFEQLYKSRHRKQRVGLLG
jgi:anti-sigma factor RsiW